MIQAIQSTICVANGVAAYVDNLISDINAIQYYESFSEQWLIVSSEAAPQVWESKVRLSKDMFRFLFILSREREGGRHH